MFDILKHISIVIPKHKYSTEKLCYKFRIPTQIVSLNNFIKTFIFSANVMMFLFKSINVKFIHVHVLTKPQHISLKY